ncbi:sirohydrochlorin cobaltochelatase [Propionivibrio dicarboxylicus]|uniref:Sirohydrochlorin cobaltochelatase n=2 Tax=Propionivibrio dicarboxylicus TaxID=83767 RepID=A0A1G7WPR5_9RHOO|nr:sirohydrochlorin cobaltochelatase [Propionivibrio dicarboxylicus]
MTKMLRTTILLAGHGSRNRDGNDEIERFAAAWRERHPELRIDVCFIEHADVLLDEGLDRAARDADGVILVPLILNAAGHVKMEMPAAVAAARERHPKVRFVVARHLGMGRDILDVLQRQLNRQMRALNVPDPQTTGVILLGRGSSDASANGELARMARWIFEENDHELVDLAFTGVTWPRLETAVQRQIKLGMTQICILPVYLFTGVLIERIAAQVERLKQQYPQVAFAVGNYFGFEPEIFAILDRRIGDDELSSGGLLECDGCKYREAAEGEHLHDHSHTGTGACAGHAEHAHEHAHCHHAHPHR